MNIRYEILWIDDEWDKMASFKEECEVIHQIKLHPFRTQKAGMEALDENLKKWDAILLDARMYDQSEEKEVAKLDGLRKAIAHINQLASRRSIPYFIFTGQPDLMSNEMFEQSFGKYYNKGMDGEKLIADMKSAIGQSTRYQVKTYYPDAVEDLSFLSEDERENVLDILEAMHFPHSRPDFTPRLYYNPLRKALEGVFRLAGKASIIPGDFFKDGQVNINQCFMFLIGCPADKIGYKATERIAPRHIQEMMSLIMNIGNINSHSLAESQPTELSEAEIQGYDNHIKQSGTNSKYLVFSMALQLCEILRWMNHYISEHPNREENQKKCVTIGESENDEKEGVNETDLIGILEEHSGICHMGSKFSVLLKHKELLGKKVKIHNYIRNTNIRTQQYPYFVREEDFDLVE